MSCDKPYAWSEGEWAARQRVMAARTSRKFHVVAYDYGVKRNILRMLAERGCKVTVLPAQTPAEEVLALKPDGVFLSNGPGDPEPCDYAIDAIRKLLDKGIPTVRHLPRPPVAGAGHRREDREDEIRPSRRQPSGAGPRQRPGDDHQPEPRLRGGCGDAAGQPARDAHVAVRRQRCRASLAPTCRRSASRGTRRRARGRTTWITCSTASSA